MRGAEGAGAAGLLRARGRGRPAGGRKHEWAALRVLRNSSDSEPLCTPPLFSMYICVSPRLLHTRVETVVWPRGQGKFYRAGASAPAIPRVRLKPPPCQAPSCAASLTSWGRAPLHTSQFSHGVTTREMLAVPKAPPHPRHTHPTPLLRKHRLFSHMPAPLLKGCCPHLRVPQDVLRDLLPESPPSFAQCAEECVCK